MKNLSTTISLAALLLVGAAPARAAAAKPQEFNRYAFADKSLDNLASKITEVKHCVSHLATLKSQLAAKKSEISAQNGGTIPPAYVDMLAIKEARLEKARTTCFTANKEIMGLVDQAHVAVKGIEPPSSSGVPKRRERLNTLQAEANAVAKTLH